MRKIITVAAASAALLVATTAVPVPAQARDGGAIAAGIITGLAAGAILGSAIGPQPVPPVAFGPVYDAPSCYWAPGRPYWNGYGWVRPRVQVCE
jgi:hypothetical protein